METQTEKSTKITDQTFKKSEQEKIDLKNAKARHKQFIKNNPLQ